MSKQVVEVDDYIIICLLLEKLTQKMPNNVEVDKNCFRARLVVHLASEISIICPDGEIFTLFINGGNDDSDNHGDDNGN